MNAVTSNLADLSAILPEYMRLSRLSAKDVLSKQGGKLARNVKQALLGIVLPAGEIRRRVLERIRGGKMINVRQNVVDEITAQRQNFGTYRAKDGTLKQKKFKLNIRQKMVAREISVRESGRRVLGVSANYPAIILDMARNVSRRGMLVSQASIALGQDRQSLTFLWPGISKASQRVVKGLAGEKPSGAIIQAIVKTKYDILVYIRRKYTETAMAALKKAIKS